MSPRVQKLNRILYNCAVCYMFWVCKSVTHMHFDLYITD